MKRFFPSSVLIGSLVLAGCAVGPDYHRADPLTGQPLPAQFDERTPTNTVPWKIAEPAAGQPRSPWWELFGDAELDRLENLALTHNENLVAAAAVDEQARDLAAAARSGYYPQLSAGGTPNGDVTRQRTSFNQPVQGQPADTTHTYNTFTAPVYLGWELDLWGRVRRESAAARARFEASADDFQSARLAVAAEVADDYFSVRTLEEQTRLITNTIASYARSYALTQNLRRGGAASDLDVAQAATQLYSAQAVLPDIELRRAQLLHALGILCGQSPVDFHLLAGARLPEVPAIPPSVPSVLLEHRPDIAAAERRMAAANADIGVAKAAFFPTIKIDGLAGLQSVSASSWFNASSRFWSVGPSVQLPLFTGGLNRANLAAAHAAYDTAVANYRQTVLGAFGEVADQLAAQRWLLDQWSVEQEAVDSAEKALKVANNRYRAGLVTYLDVVTEQTQALAIEQTALQLQGERLTAAVNLIKALGAGWDPPTP